MAQAASLSPSRAGEVAPSAYVVQGGQQARERGVRLHKLLELMTAQSDEAQVRGLLRYLAPDWSAQEQQRALNEVMALHRAEHWLWQGERMPEVNISGVVDNARVHGQIDLLIATADGYVIVDYKTGNHVPERAADIPESYRTQLALYQALVAQLYPQARVRTALLWTSGPKLMWVGEEVMERAAS